MCAYRYVTYIHTYIHVCTGSFTYRCIVILYVYLQDDLRLIFFRPCSLRISYLHVVVTPLSTSFLLLLSVTRPRKMAVE